MLSGTLALDEAQAHRKANGQDDAGNAGSFILC
jgi:hypothetical protein